MVIKLGKKEVELKYTFNSFKYMQDFDPNAFAEVEDKPFKILPLIEMLLMGAVNHDPKVKFTEIEVQSFIETYSEEGSLVDLLTEMITKLQESNFFKSLQKK